MQEQSEYQAQIVLDTRFCSFLLGIVNQVEQGIRRQSLCLGLCWVLGLHSQSRHKLGELVKRNAVCYQLTYFTQGQVTVLAYNPASHCIKKIVAITNHFPAAQSASVILCNQYRAPLFNSAMPGVSYFAIFLFSKKQFLVTQIVLGDKHRPIIRR
jgi:hypothetical protein